MTNEEEIRQWSGERGAHWAREQQRYDRMLEPFTRHVVAAAQQEPVKRALDVGCGNGALSLAMASAVSGAGAVTGIDISAPMLAVARRRAGEAGLSNVDFVEADAQVHDLGSGAFDVVVSRFGVMFFDDPPAAFSNLGRSLRPGGRIVFVCWRDLLVNEWLAVPAGAALEHVPMPDLGDGTGPGPFSLADPMRVESLLGGAGFDDVNLTEVDEPTWMGSSGHDTLTFMRQTDIASALMENVDDDTAERAWAAVARVLDERSGPDGVILGASAWLVSGRRRP